MIFKAARHQSTRRRQRTRSVGVGVQKGVKSGPKPSANASEFGAPFLSPWWTRPESPLCIAQWNFSLYPTRLTELLNSDTCHCALLDEHIGYLIINYALSHAARWVCHQFLVTVASLRVWLWSRWVCIPHPRLIPEYYRNWNWMDRPGWRCRRCLDSLIKENQSHVSRIESTITIFCCSTRVSNGGYDSHNI